MSKADPDPSYVCDACGSPSGVNYLSLEIATTPDEGEEDAFFLCAPCTQRARGIVMSCTLAEQKFSPPSEIDRFVPTGIAVVRLSPIDDDDSDHEEAWRLCEAHSEQICELRRAPQVSPLECPGERHCYARGGNQPCREHGCRVCGAPILADCEDWPAPLCIAHAPERLFDAIMDLRHATRSLLEHFDGTHAADCSSWSILGKALSDATLEAVLQQRGELPRCSCGAYTLRKTVRERFHLSDPTPPNEPPS